MCQINHISEMECKAPFSFKIEQISRNIIKKIILCRIFIIGYLKKLCKIFLRFACPKILSNIYLRKERSKGSKNFNSLCLNQGDIVRIRSKEEIIQTLGGNNKLNGCLFMNEMQRYCGGKYKVLKRIEYFFNEAKSRMVRTRNLVLLQGLHCSGKIPYFKHRCDRYCLFFWNEAWLEKIE